jgi:hypothetical protein
MNLWAFLMPSDRSIGFSPRFPPDDDGYAILFTTVQDQAKQVLSEMKKELFHMNNNRNGLKC